MSTGGKKLSLLREFLAAGSGRRSEEAADVDELSSILLQISLAVMLVFMIAVFLFINKTGGELQHLENLKQEVARARRERIDNALELLSQKYRVVYGITPFLEIDPVSGKKSYHFPPMISQGKFRDNSAPAKAFRAGSRQASEDFRDRERLHQRWMEELAALIGPVEPDLIPYAQSSVEQQCGILRGEVVEIQSSAAAKVQEYFADHPGAVRDESVTRLLREAEKAPDEESRRFIAEKLSGKLKVLAIRHLEKECRSAMLEEER